VRAAINLVRPDWTRFRAVFNILVHCGGLVVVYFLIKAGSWVEAAGPLAEHANDYARTAEIVNQWIYIGLLIAAIFSALMLVVKIARLVRQPRHRAGSTGVSAPLKEGN
jgi:TRAP-type C4-dicarboxylate transport system permease small subunit